MKYYKVNVTMKNGFKYSYTCIGRMLEGMKASSQGYWTEKIEVVEITEKEHYETRDVTFKEDKVLRKAIVKSGKLVDKGKLVEKPVEKNSVVKKSNPKFSSLENFFDGGEEAPENKKSKKRV